MIIYAGIVDIDSSYHTKDKEEYFILLFFAIISYLEIFIVYFLFYKNKKKSFIIAFFSFIFFLYMIPFFNIINPLCLIITTSMIISLYEITIIVKNKFFNKE